MPSDTNDCCDGSGCWKSSRSSVGFVQVDLLRQRIADQTDQMEILLGNGRIIRIRPVAIGRKNYLFAGSRRGARNAAAIYSLMATCALNDIQPDKNLADVLDKLIHDWPAKSG